MRTTPIAKVQARTVPVYSRMRKQVERLTPTAHQRLRLMFLALEAGLEQTPGAAWWAALSPLKDLERVGVRQEVSRLLGMKPEDRSAELLLLKQEGNIP